MPTDMQIDASTWRRRDAGDCAWAEYGEATVAYHRPSMTTHLLNPASIRLLTDLLLEPQSVDAICRTLLPDGNPDSAGEDRAALHALLGRLESLGLVEQLPGDD